MAAVLLQSSGKAEPNGVGSWWILKKVAAKMVPLGLFVVGLCVDVFRDYTKKCSELASYCRGF